ncbi:MAG: hypothetical protein WC617_09830 [Rhodanobacter sp.]|jgi:hypothetical protein
MIRSFQLRCRTRRRLIWLVTLLLLWQQVALAGSVCSSPVPAAAAMVVPAAMTRADSMGTMPMHAHDPLCAEHCAQGASAQPDARVPNVPSSMLQALPLLSPAVHRLVGNVALLEAGALLPAETPPPRLRFCSLLI